MDSKLNWKAHIKKLLPKISKNAAIVFLLFRIVIRYLYFRGQLFMGASQFNLLSIITLKKRYSSLF